MRLRNIRGSREIIAQSPYVVREPETWKDRWSGCFGTEGEIRLEIGMGKGRFLSRMAAENPRINYLGVEKYSSVLLRALERQAGEEPVNLKFIRMDAEQLCSVFGEGEIGWIYLNFSDPWPKDRHAKRRLTSRSFLERYDHILAPGGGLCFKTDNQELFSYSVEEIRAYGWEISRCTRDLHRSEYAAGNIMTEYEEKFSAAGNPICYLKAVRGKNKEEGGKTRLTE